MGLSTKVGSFNTGTGAVSSTVVVNDVGFQPKVILFWWNGRTGTVDASGRANHQRGFGIATSSTDRRYSTSLSQDTPTAMVTNTMQGNAACIGITTTADAIDGLMDVSSFDSGGFTLVVDDVFVASYRIHYLALGGSDITNVATGQFTGNAAGVTGNQDITSVGFQPDFVLAFTTGQASNNNTVRADSRIMLSIANSTNSAVWAGGSNDAAANAQAMAYCRSGEFISLFNTGLTGLDDRATFTGFLSNGFNVNWSTVTVGGAIINFLAIKGGLNVIGDLLTQTNTITAITETGFGFSPKAALLISAGRAASTANTPTDDDEWSMGAFTSTSARVAMSMSDDDGAATAVVGTGVSHDEVYQNLLNTSGAVEGEMDVQSVDSDGFTLIMDDADPAQAFVFYVAFGQASLTKTVSGDISPSSTLTKQDNKATSGALTPSGASLKLTSKSFSGAISTITGALLKQADKLLSGTLTSGGNLSASIVFSKILSGTLTASGNLLKQTNKVLSGILAGAGSLVAEFISGGETFFQNLSGTLSSAGNLEKLTNKLFGGGIIPSGTLTKFTNKLFNGLVTPSGETSASGLFAKILNGTLEFTGTISKLIDKIFFGSLTPGGSTNKSTSKQFSGILTSGSILSSIRLFVKDLSGVLNFSGIISKSTNKLNTGNLAPSGNISKRTDKIFSGSLASSGSLTVVKTFIKLLEGILSFSGELIKTSNKQLFGIFSSSGGINKLANKFTSGEINFTGVINKSINKFISGILNLVGNVLGFLSGTQPTPKIVYLLGTRIYTIAVDGHKIESINLDGNRIITINIDGRK